MPALICILALIVVILASEGIIEELEEQPRSLLSANTSSFNSHVQTPRPVAEGSRLLHRQPHIRQSGQSSFISAVPQAVAEPLQVFTPSGLVKHSSLTKSSKYDPIELFKEEIAIGLDGRHKLIIDPHPSDGSLFFGLTFYHFRVLLYYINGGNMSKGLLRNWNIPRVTGILKGLSAMDIKQMTRYSDGCYFLGIVFKYLDPAKVVQAEIPPECMVDMLCMFSPAPHFYDQEYDLAFLIKRYPDYFLQANRGLIMNKLGYPLDFTSRPPRLIGFAFAEKFFMDTGLIEDGKPPFTVSTFSAHTPLLFRNMSAGRLRSFIRWATGQTNKRVLSMKNVDQAKAKAVLGLLSRADIHSISDSEDKCKVLSWVLEFIDVFQLPVGLLAEQVQKLLSRVSWHTNAQNIIPRLNPIWIERQKQNIMPLLVDHYPRAEAMSKDMQGVDVEIFPAEAEKYFLETGIILDGVAPFSPESFADRSPALLMKASRRSIVNLAHWMELGGIERAKGLVSKISAKELSYFERKKILHVFDQLFPLMNMEAVIAADLLQVNMVRLLGKIGEPKSTFGFTWELLDELPASFFANYSYAAALIEVVCKKFMYHQLPDQTITILRKLYGDGIPKKKVWWTRIAADLHVSEQQERVRAIIADIKSAGEQQEALSTEINLKLAEIEIVEGNFQEFCFGLESELKNPFPAEEARRAVDIYIDAVDSLLSIHTFHIKHIQ